MSPVSNTSARQGTGVAISPSAFLTIPKRRFLSQKRSHRDVTASTALFGAEKCAKGLEKQNHLKFSPPKSLLHTEVGLGPGAGRVRAGCGPGAGLAILRWAQGCSLNPALATGLPHPLLRSQQDCPGPLPAALAWSRSCQSTVL